MSAPQPPPVHYVHRLSYTARERLVGAFVLFTLGVLLALVFVNGRTAHLFETRLTYHAYLRNAQGVTEDTVVKISGIEVGRVAKVDISPDNRIHLTFYVLDRFGSLLRADSKASLSKLSLLGKASIEITAGSPSQPLVEEGATLVIEEPKTLDDLVAELTPVVEQLKGTIQGVADIVAAIDPKRLESTTHDIAGVAENLNTITRQIAQGEGALGHAISSRELRNQVDRSVATLDRSLALVEARLAELKPFMENVNATAASAATVTREIQPLIADLRQLTAQVNVLAGSMNAELQGFPELMTRMKVLMEEADRTMIGVQRIWPVSGTLPPRPEDTVAPVRPITQ